MRTAAITAALFAAIAAASDVHDLKKDTFESFIKEHDLVLAECMCNSPPSIYLAFT
jgi:protein disulfide-isomerase A1